MWKNYRTGKYKSLKNGFTVEAAVPINKNGTIGSIKLTKSTKESQVNNFIISSIKIVAGSAKAMIAPLYESGGLRQAAIGLSMNSKETRFYIVLTAATENHAKQQLYNLVNMALFAARRAEMDDFMAYVTKKLKPSYSGKNVTILAAMPMKEVENLLDVAYQKRFGKKIY